MNMRYFSPLLAVVLFATATAAQAAVHKVYPGESIQAAIDIAAPGDTIMVEPGIYQAPPGSTYGLHITTDNLRLIGKVKKGKGEEGKVRLVYQGEFYNEDNDCLAEDKKDRAPVCDTGQRTGVFAAPDGCEFEMNEGECKAALGLGDDDAIPYVKDFYIRGFSVEKFPRNGIQTRWVEGFEFVRNESVENLNNGIYPTLSANGLVRNNESYGSLDTAMWVAGSENVRVIGNKLHGSVIGFEITVSNEVEVKQNEMYDNTVGVGLFHPNGAGNPPLPVMANWLIEQNDIYDNNRPNAALPETFQAILPPGVGVLLSGVSDAVIAKNNVEDNDYVGIAVVGWCTGLGIENPADCLFYGEGDDRNTLRAPPQSNNNLVALNKLSGNAGEAPPPGGALPSVDLVYAQGVENFVPPAEPSGNCFEKNKPKNDLTSFSLPPLFDGSFDPDDLPTDGC
jgi:parallel beta-helix repeat protein